MDSFSEGHGKQSRRSSRVCKYCQQRKVRCDFIVCGSPCTNCSHFGVECVVPEKIWKCSNGSPVQNFETLLKDCDGLKENPLPPIATISEWEAVNVEELIKSIVDYDELGEETEGQTVNLRDPMFSSPAIVNDRDIFGNLIDESKPNFIKRSHTHLEPHEMQYLRVKGALLMPVGEFRRDLLRAFVRRVYYVLPILNIFEFLSGIVSNDGRYPISLLLFQAVMLSAIPYVTLDRVVAEGFSSRKKAQEVFLQRVMALYNVGYETEQLPIIQASLLLSLIDDPTTTKDSWHWLGISLSFAQAVNFHLDTPGYCEGDKGLSRRIWWSIFTQDRKLALDMKYPCRIRDDSYQVPMLALHDFKLHCADPKISYVLGHDMGLQDTVYQKKLALITIQTNAMSVVIGEILMLQYTPPPRAFFIGELPSVTVIPRRTATRQNIQLYEHKLALCMNCADAGSQWVGENASRRLATSEGDAFSLLRVETSLMHLTTLMALHRPQMWPVKTTTSTAFDLQAYSQYQARIAASNVLEICNVAQEKGLLSEASHITTTCVHQAALIHLAFVTSTDAVERTSNFNKFNQCFQILKDMDAIHMTAKLGLSLLDSLVQKMELRDDFAAEMY